MTQRGQFLTLEGGEGAGKSTQARLLAEALCRRGIPVLRTREPGGAPGAEILRGILLDPFLEWASSTEVYLHFAARSEHLERTVLPALAAGIWVVCDRFYDSTVAYQAFGQGADRNLINTLIGYLPVHPDITFVLDISQEPAYLRRLRRSLLADRYEHYNEQFHTTVRAGFRSIAKENPHRCRLIPADGSEDEVQAAILSALDERFPP